jgi:glycosyltransferase involved in cell wall biosynthesis
MDWEVPEYLVTEFQPRRTRYCLCTFVINEGERIIAQLGRMRAIAPAIDIIIADGGSTDGSLLPERLAALNVRALLVKQGGGKLSAQMRMAFAYALQADYAGVVTIDGNNKDDPAAIPSFIHALDQGYDHLQGSRFIEGGVAINTPWQRWLGVKLVHAPLISLAARFRYTDTTNGFRAYSRRFLLDPRVAPFRRIFSTYELHYYLAIRAPRLGYRTKELPVTRAYPRRGPLPTKISPLKGNLLVIRTLARACLHQFDPPEDSLNG